MLATGVRDGFQQFVERIKMGLRQQVVPFFFYQEAKGHDVMQYNTFGKAPFGKDRNLVFLSYPFWEPLSLSNNSQTLAATQPARGA